MCPSSPDSGLLIMASRETHAGLQKRIEEIQMNKTHECLMLSLVLGIVALVFVNVAGCVAGPIMAIHDSAVKKFPSYAETKGAWPAITDGMGRVIVFFPKVSTALQLVGGMQTGVAFAIDDSVVSSIQDQQFVFIDLPPGKHSIKLKGMVFGGGPKDFDVAPGATTYVRLLDRAPLGRNLIATMSAEEAEPLLVQTYHLFRLPIAFDKQDKEAERQAW